MRSFIFQKNNTRLQSTVAQTIVGGVGDDQKNSESSNLALNTNQRTCVCTHLWHNSVDFYTMLTDFQMPIAKKCFAIKLPIQNFPGKEKCLTNDRPGDLPAVILHRIDVGEIFFPAVAQYYTDAVVKTRQTFHKPKKKKINLCWCKSVKTCRKSP